MHSVHPRVCGEHADVARDDDGEAGSSPRVRGTQLMLGEAPFQQRFIPACAGNTMASPFARPPGTVHPRVCGEHVSSRTRVLLAFRFIPACAGNTVAMHSYESAGPVHPRVCGEHGAVGEGRYTSIGSSPRVRGTLGGVGDLRPFRRFIPACAGNTAARSRLRTVSPVHPRVCGEHGTTPSGNNASNGSSPRVRGTQPQSTTPTCARRFIPACAGNTRCPPARSPRRPVHPRVCGEHVRRLGSVQPCCGSSPRVRGTPQRPHRVQHLQRFIPACAGNTGPCLRRRSRTPVHPRVCGEHPAIISIRRAWSGSSPRVRGTRALFDQRAHVVRFIPACAGNTMTAWRIIRLAPVHPRVCGEHRAAMTPRHEQAGSSPRVRGTPRLPVLDTTANRFIPACAGNTMARATRAQRTWTVHPRVCGEHPVHIPRITRQRFIPACAGNTASPARTFAPPSVHPRVCGEHATGADGKPAHPGSSPRVRGTRGLTSAGRRRIGSSPRVRGTHGIASNQAVFVRFIPACAGNTWLARRGTHPRTVHPRVCGEHLPNSINRLQVQRFIPACAGNTSLCGPG